MIPGLLLGALAWVLAGVGLACLLIPPRATDAGEITGLAAILGTVSVSMVSFVLGQALGPAAVCGTVAALAIGAALAGIVRARRLKTRFSFAGPRGPRQVAWLGVLGVQALVIGWQAMNQACGWDGLFNWELKARFAFASGLGHVPHSYYHDLSRIWSHPTYPPFLPQCYFWLYSWMGECDQGLAKLHAVLFLVAMMGMLATAGARLGEPAWRGQLSAALLCFVPMASLGPGGAASGWADFPLALGYLAALFYLLESRHTGSLRLFSVTSGVLPWIKQEGIILWGCLMLLALLAHRRRIGVVGLAALPGLAVYGAWQGFLAILGVAGAGDSNFQAFSLTGAWAGLDRGPIILSALCNRLINWREWSLLWPMAMLALFQLRRRDDRLAVLLGLAMVLPIAAYCGSYLFSSYPNIASHLNTSLSRLMIHVSPVALVAVVLGIPGRPVAGEEARAPQGS